MLDRADNPLQVGDTVIYMTQDSINIGKIVKIYANNRACSIDNGNSIQTNIRSYRIYKAKPILQKLIEIEKG